MRQIWERIRDLWDFGNFWIRLAIVLIPSWPVAFALAVVFGGMRGDAAVSLALMPAVALVLLLLVIPPMLPVLVLALPERLRQIQFPSRATRLRVLKRALKFLTLVAGIELAIGIYLACVPVWNDPGLLWWLLAITVVFVLLWFGGVRSKWLVRGFLIAVLVITAIFIAGGRKGILNWQEERQRRQAERVAAAQAERLPKVFKLNAGEEKPTVRSGPGIFYRIRATKDGQPVTWIAIAAGPDGRVIEHLMPAGNSRWGGSEPEDLIWAKGVEDGTTLLRFERE